MILKNLTLSLCLFFTSCAMQQHNLIIVDIKSSGMALQRDGQMITVRSNARLVFDNGMQIYIRPEIHLNLEYIKDKNGEVIDEKVKSMDTTHVVFVRSKSQKKGIEYLMENMDTIPAKAFEADSLWKTLPFYGEGMKNFDRDIGSPSKTYKKGRIKVQVYSLKPEAGQPDSVYRFYDQSMLDIPYSFSEKLDKANGSKLFKIFLIANPVPKGVIHPDMAVPRREFFHEMKIVKEKDPKKYLDIFKKFEEDSKAMNLN